jgi:hypothetical protein
MTFLILTADYPEFLHWLNAEQPDLKRRPYADQQRTRMDTLFGGPFFYSENLKKLGHEATEIYVNNEPMQKMWAQEHKFRWKEDWRWRLRLRRGIVPWISRVRERWLYDILAAQIRYYKPDVILNQAMDTIDSRFLREIKPHVRLLVGEHAASPLPDGFDLSAHDLVVSSFPPTVDRFRRHGIRAALHRLGFGPEWLAPIADAPRPFDLTFVGNFFSIHSSRLALLEELAARFPQLKIWAPDIHRLPAGSPIRSRHQGPAWGRQMYEIFAKSKITVNHHGDILPHANNARLYEATGMGSLLVTDWKDDLREMFEPGREVVAYRSPAECAELIEYYLTHDTEREAIARAGHERTMREHTSFRRMTELVDIVSRYL